MHVDERDANDITLLQVACQMHGKACAYGMYNMEPVCYSNKCRDLKLTYKPCVGLLALNRFIISSNPSLGRSRLYFQ